MVKNDIEQALDDNNAVFLVMLDLSAAFDTIDHGILMQRLYVWSMALVSKAQPSIGFTRILLVAISRFQLVVTCL